MATNQIRQRIFWVFEPTATACMGKPTAADWICAIGLLDETVLLQYNV
jgi:hypothetical protein